MLSGRVPFQSYSREASAAAIMQRIREGEFSFAAPQWELVSQQAKSVIRGLLTVDPKQRLTMTELLSHPWVQGHLRGGYSSTPLMTPDVLSSHSNSSRMPTETAIKATFDAFHMARREGFRLLDVSAAPLAQRRKLKKSSTDARSSSCSSVSSVSGSTGTSSSSSSLSLRRTSSLTTPTGLRPPSDPNDSVFNYSESKVSAYLSALPSISDSTEAQLLLSHNLYFEEPQHQSVQSSLSDSTPSPARNKRVREESCEIIDEFIKSSSTSTLKNDSNTNPNPTQAKRPRLDTIVID